jgi:NitT/TauT family transport system ATP-binding protein
MSGKDQLSFRDVSVRFDGAPNEGWVVRNVSLTLEQGEFVSLVGPSGCGKTTLLKLAAGMLKPTIGNVTLNGAPIDGLGPDRGVVFQEYGVFPWLTVRKNIEFGLRLAASKDGGNGKPNNIDATVDRYLSLMGLVDFQHSLPHTISGGMRQRVALARTYAVNPGVLLLDEPFGALDAQTRQLMQDLLLTMQQEEAKTVLLITHSVEEALYLSNKVVVVSARPARIKEVIEVPFPYPRNEQLLADPSFIALQAHLRERVMAEYLHQQDHDREARKHTELTGKTR